MRREGALAAAGVIVATLAALATPALASEGFPDASQVSPDESVSAAVGIHKIKHVIVIMQENRSFDTYFGTFPGADGLPHNASGQFTVCSPDPATGQCVYPYHDGLDKNGGGPHGA